MITLADPDTCQQILRRIAVLQPASIRRWGRMSPHQMLCHLSDSFEAALGERYASSATGLLQRTLIKRIALYTPVRWPKGVPTRPEVEQGRGGTPPVDFELDRLRLVKSIERFTATPGPPESVSHPAFGPMTRREWMRWGYLHTDHHLRQFGV